jgi:DNA-binding MarR family transcriptional regulator
MDTATPQLELDNQLCFALYDASRAVVRSYGPLLDGLGLTYPQYLTMLVLWESDGPVSMGQLGARLHLDSGTLTPLVKRLVHLGMVERQRDAADERRVLVSLTDQGESLRQQACDIPERLFGHLGIGVDEARSLHRTLGRIVTAIEDHDPATSP